MNSAPRYSCVARLILKTSLDMYGFVNISLTSTCIQGHKAIKKFNVIPDHKVCLFECLFYIRLSDFCCLLKDRHVMGALIMTSIEDMGKSF